MESMVVKPPISSDELKNFFSETNFFGKGCSLSQRQQQLKQFLNDIVVFQIILPNAEVVQFKCARHLLVDCPCTEGTICSCKHSLLLTFGPSVYRVRKSKEEDIRSDEVTYVSVIWLISQSHKYVGTTPPWYTFVHNDNRALYIPQDFEISQTLGAFIKEIGQHVTQQNIYDYFLLNGHLRVDKTTFFYRKLNIEEIAGWKQQIKNMSCEILFAN